MHITTATVREEHARMQEHAPMYVALMNETRAALGEHFDQTVDPVDEPLFEAALQEVFADGDRAVNIAGICRILRALDVDDDYPGFVVDEFLGRQLAATIAGGEPLRLLAEATFHFVDIRYDDRNSTAGSDDLDAGIAAGFQTIIPGWEWRQTDSPFAIDPN